jgi:uncharacterized protein (TIGR01615 family)
VPQSGWFVASKSLHTRDLYPLLRVYNDKATCANLQKPLQGLDDSEERDIVIECAFSSHFRIPCATKAYLALLDTVPEVFVGSLARMLPLVDLMTRELARSFADMGVTMPPWRSARSVMSKWAPQKATDRMPSGTSSPRSGTKLPSLENGHPCLPRVLSHPRQGHSARITNAGALTQSGEVTRRGRVDSSGRQLFAQKSGGSPVMSVKVGFDFP